MKDAFAAAPRTNPDGMNGVTLHVDTGSAVDPTAREGQPLGTCNDGIDNGGDGLADGADVTAPRSSGAAATTTSTRPSRTRAAELPERCRRRRRRPPRRSRSRLPRRRQPRWRQRDHGFARDLQPRRSLLHDQARELQREPAAHLPLRDLDTRRDRLRLRRPGRDRRQRLRRPQRRRRHDHARAGPHPRPTARRASRTSTASRTSCR